MNIIPNYRIKTKKNIMKYYMSLNTPLSIDTRKLNPSYILRKKFTFKKVKIITIISNKMIPLIALALSSIANSMMLRIV